MRIIIFYIVGSTQLQCHKKLWLHSLMQKSSACSGEQDCSSRDQRKLFGTSQTLKSITWRKTSSGVNFTNIWRATFSYESVMSSFSILTLCVCIFFQTEMGCSWNVGEIDYRFLQPATSYSLLAIGLYYTQMTGDSSPYLYYRYLH